MNHNNNIFFAFSMIIEGQYLLEIYHLVSQ